MCLPSQDQPFQVSMYTNIRTNERKQNLSHTRRDTHSHPLKHERMHTYTYTDTHARSHTQWLTGRINEQINQETRVSCDNQSPKDKDQELGWVSISDLCIHPMSEPTKARKLLREMIHILSFMPFCLFMISEKELSGCKRQIGSFSDCIVTVNITFMTCWKIYLCIEGRNKGKLELDFVRSADERQGKITN